MEAPEPTRRPLGEVLLDKGLLTRQELDLALAEHEESGRLLGSILVERGFVSGPTLAVILAERYGVELSTERGFGPSSRSCASSRRRTCPARIWSSSRRPSATSCSSVRDHRPSPATR